MVQDQLDQLEQNQQVLAQALGTDLGGGEKTVNVFGGGVASRVGALNPRKYVVVETDDLDGVSEGGSVTLSPGEEKTLVRAEAHTDTGLALLAVGATDEPNVSYTLEVDGGQQVVGGRTNSPLGLLTDPFSFVNEFNAVIPVKRYVEYKARYDESASGDISLAGRLHVEML